MNVIARWLSPMEHIQRQEAAETGRYRQLRESIMNSHIPKVEAQIIPFERPSASAERAYLEQKIAHAEREIGRLGGQIRWWKLELEGL